MNTILCSAKKAVWLATLVGALIVAASTMVSFPAYAKSSVPEDEVKALWAIYTFTNPSRWYVKTNWGFDVDFTSDAQPDPCTFYGVTCGAIAQPDPCEFTALPCGGLPGEMHVIGLELKGNRLDGTLLPGVFKFLPYLKILDLENNELNRSIPMLGSNRHLSTVKLGSNYFTWLRDLPPRVEHFSARSNMLAGPIPALPSSLEYFDVSDNELTGSIPALPSSLIEFFASSNQLTGSIPALPSSLTELFLGWNELSGPIPALPSSLILFDVVGNNLTGPIPKLPSSLVYFRADMNRLSGTIPPLSASLMQFHVLQNQLTGSIPSLPLSLLAINLSYNELTGSIPVLPPSLEYLEVSSNKLTGSIPSLPASLKTMDLSDNSLSGPLPSVPLGSALRPGSTKICPNYLLKKFRPEWDKVTGIYPWYRGCY